eukprot:TRINITY_DN5696_c0_g1_i1.p1 TRINITY_DN5696_c0_g1~~TRINITY_DN5696_c0_g1_i1.p1  ORF type:complete len:260 (+),score=12.22 TRINITY_DN5696_c0_g1_i1:52-831(+)
MEWSYSRDKPLETYMPEEAAEYDYSFQGGGKGSAGGGYAYAQGGPPYEMSDYYSQGTMGGTEYYGGEYSGRYPPTSGGMEGYNYGVEQDAMDYQPPSFHYSSGGSGGKAARSYPNHAHRPSYKGSPSTSYAKGGKGHAAGPSSGTPFLHIPSSSDRGSSWDPAYGVNLVVTYFRTHLLLREYRPTGVQAGHPRAEACVGDFKRFIQYITCSNKTQGPLDLVAFEQLCRKFSSEWEGVCHWLNHKILSSFLNKKLNILWR